MRNSGGLISGSLGHGSTSQGDWRIIESPFINVKWNINSHSVILLSGLACRVAEKKRSALRPRITRVVFSFDFSESGRTEETTSPRPRQTSDEAILMATMRVMQRRSPVDLTLADVAKEAGVVPATLVQRFGTKRGLLLAACRTALPGGVPEQFGAARAKYGSPLKSLIELYAECSGFAFDA